MEEILRIQDTYRRLDGDARNRGKWSYENLGNLMALEERRRCVKALLTEHQFLPLAGKRVLDVGCGFGRELAYFRELGAKPENLFGVDLSEDRVREAQTAFPGLNFSCGNAESLAFPDQYFDLICFSTVFSSILDDTLAGKVAAEATRILKPSGAILWYDFRFPSHTNRNTRPMRKKHLNKFFTGFSVDLRSLTVLPPLARAFGKANAFFYPWLSHFSFLRSHYMAILTR